MTETPFRVTLDLRIGTPPASPAEFHLQSEVFKTEWELFRDLPQQLAVDNPTFRSLFPNNGAGLFSYQQAVQFYGSSYQLREPRKTFRLTVGTTF